MNITKYKEAEKNLKITILTNKTWTLEQELEEAQRALEDAELDLADLEEDAFEIESELAELDIDPAREIYLSNELSIIEHQIEEKQGEVEICKDDIETIEEELEL
jgi:predicted  nucleic acid-binding Zn-ribbon protein